VLDSLVQSRRHQHAAQQCCRTLLQGLPAVPRVILPAKLQSDGAAPRESLPGVEQRQSRDRKQRGENSHRPTRQRADRRPGGKSPGQAQRCLSADGPMAPPCRPRRHRVSALAYRAELHNRCASWTAITGTERAAERAQRTAQGRPLVLCALPPPQLDNASTNDLLQTAIN
jgi:putative transposase